MRLTNPQMIPLPAETPVKANWLQVVFSPPRPGRSYVVKHRFDGTPFYAWLSYDYRWFSILPDENADGTRELGERVIETQNLFYVGTNQCSS